MLQKEKREGKIRCFIAVEIPEEIKKKIESLRNEIAKQKGIKLVSLDNIHITLKFLGYISKENLKIVKEKLAEVQFSSFSVEIKGIKVFPNEKNPRVLWIDCQSDGLVDLAKRINDVLAKEFPIEDFTAHLTIARLKKPDKEKIQEFIIKHKEEKYGTFICKDFELKKSILQKEGPVHTTLEKYFPIMMKAKKPSNKILSIGAEAVIYLNKKENKIIKERKKKEYRILEIDNRLRSSRTRREVKVLEKLNPLSFTPKVLFADNKSILEMEYINGMRLSECLEKKAWKKIGKEIGKKVKQIHEQGIIHGDLTTSNLILKDNTVFFIDFGLSFFSQKTEDKAVDIHVLEKALESKHYTISKKMFAAVKKGYNDAVVLKRLEEVEARGRNKKVS